MDPFTIILVTGGILATICFVGIVRNWNKNVDPATAGEPQNHLTIVGWLLALFAVSVVITSIILAWQAGLLPPMLLRGLGQKGLVVLGLIAGLLSFFVPALILHRIGVRAWRCEKQMEGVVSLSKPQHKQLRYRLGEQQSEQKE